MNRWIRIISLLAAFLLAAGVLAGCGEKTEKEDADKNILIETDYGTLYYPIEWNDRFSFEISEDEPYTVKFIGKISDKTSADLFSIVFGEKGEILLGKITGDKGCNIYTTPGAVDKKWTDDEKTTFYAMQEEMNYTVEKLTRLKGFEAVK